MNKRIREKKYNHILMYYGKKEWFSLFETNLHTKNRHFKITKPRKIRRYTNESIKENFRYFILCLDPS